MGGDCCRPRCCLCVFSSQRKCPLLASCTCLHRHIFLAVLGCQPTDGIGSKHLLSGNGYIRLVELDFNQPASITADSFLVFKKACRLYLLNTDTRSDIWPVTKSLYAGSAALSGFHHNLGGSNHHLYGGAKDPRELALLGSY